MPPTKPNQDRQQQFRTHVEQKAEDLFGEENVHTNYDIDRIDETADIYIETEWLNIVCEVCNTWQQVINGVGRTHLYAVHTKNTVPCVLVPFGQVKEPDVTMLRYSMPIVEVALG